MKCFPMWVLCLGMLMLLGCKAQGPQGPHHLVDVIDAGKMGYSLVWTSDVGLPEDQRLRLTETTGDLLITVEHGTNLLTAVRLRDGIVQWQRIVSVGREQILSAKGRGSNLIVATENSSFQLDVQTGQTLGQIGFTQTVAAGPIIWDRFLISGGTNGLVFSQDVNNGFLRWSYQMTDLIPYAPIEQGGTVFVADRRGVIAALLASNGTVIWRRQPTDALTAAAVLTTDTVYVPTIENKLHAIDRSNGRDRWIYRSQQRLVGSPRVLDKQILQPLDDDQWASLDPATGREQWRIEGAFYQVLPVRQGLLFAGRDRLVLVDRMSGQVLIQAMTHPTFAIHALGEDVVLVGVDGRLLRLQSTR